MKGLPDAALRKEYRRRIWNVIKRRRDPGITLYYIIKCAMHYHAKTMAEDMASGHRAIVNSF